MVEEIDVSDKKIFEQSLSKLGKIISTVKYGSVTAIIKEGKIVQIEKNEKVRVK